MTLTFKQLESGLPPDIEVTTDDSQAELAETTQMFEKAGMDEFEVSFHNLNVATRNDEGKFTFVIPGDEAGELSDIWMELADFLEKCNVEAFDALADAEIGA